MLSLRVFGGLTLTSSDGPVAVRASQRRRLALLAILAVAKARPVSRDKLVALLWPDADADRARHLLADSIYVLRDDLGADVLVTAGDDVSLNPEQIGSDVMEALAKDASSHRCAAPRSSAVTSTSRDSSGTRPSPSFAASACALAPRPQRRCSAGRSGSLAAMKMKLKRGRSSAT